MLELGYLLERLSVEAVVAGSVRYVAQQFGPANSFARAIFAGCVTFAYAEPFEVRQDPCFAYLLACHLP